MPRVHFSKEIYEVDPDLYEWFLDELLIEEKPMQTVFREMKPEHAEKLGKYITFRLIEVDPGYAPSYEDGAK